MTDLPLPLSYRYAAFVFLRPPLHFAFIGFLLGSCLGLLLMGAASPDVPEPPLRGEEAPLLPVEFLAAGMLLGPVCGAVAGMVAPLVVRRFPDRLGPAWTARQLLLRGEAGDDPEVAARVIRMARRMLDMQSSFLLDRPFSYLLMALWGLGFVGSGFFALRCHADGRGEEALLFALFSLFPLFMAAVMPLNAYSRFLARRVLAAVE